jgi:hypothetical protein
VLVPAAVPPIELPGRPAGRTDCTIASLPDVNRR